MCVTGFYKEMMGARSGGGDRYTRAWIVLGILKIAWTHKMSHSMKIIKISTLVIALSLSIFVLQCSTIFHTPPLTHLDTRHFLFFTVPFWSHKVISHFSFLHSILPRSFSCNLATLKLSSNRLIFEGLCWLKSVSYLHSILQVFELLSHYNGVLE